MISPVYVDWYRVLKMNLNSREIMSDNINVAVRKATPIDFEFAFALEGTLSEWSSKNAE